MLARIDEVPHHRQIHHVHLAETITTGSTRIVVTSELSARPHDEGLPTTNRTSRRRIDVEQTYQGEGHFKMAYLHRPDNREFRCIKRQKITTLLRCRGPDYTKHTNWKQ